MCGGNMCGGKKCNGSKLGWVLVMVGALNWGLVGAFQYNLVESLLGGWPTVLRVVYALVGLSAVMLLVGCRCKMCMAGHTESK